MIPALIASDHSNHTTTDTERLPSANITSMPSETDIWRCSTDAARHAREMEGRARYRQSPSDPFQGDPLTNLLEEMLDALNYLDEHERQRGAGPLSYAARYSLIGVVAIVRALHDLA